MALSAHGSRARPDAPQVVYERAGGLLEVASGRVLGHIADVHPGVYHELGVVVGAPELSQGPAHLVQRLALRQPSMMAGHCSAGGAPRRSCTAPRRPYGRGTRWC